MLGTIKHSPLISILASNRHKMVKAVAPWLSTEDLPATKRNLELLMQNKVASVVVPNFLSHSECQQIVTSLSKHNMSLYPSVDPPIAKLGITQFEHGIHNKQEYLQKVDQAYLFHKSFPLNPLEKVLAMLRKLYPERTVKIMEEDDGSKYFAGLVRRIDQGAHLHFDHAPFDAGNHWKIGTDVTNQISWNLYLSDPGEGGECCVYNRTVDISQIDYASSYPSTLPNLKASIDGVKVKILKPQVGTLTLFNTVNFHEVRPASKPRFTMSSFIGKTKGGEIVLWS